MSKTVQEIGMIVVGVVLMVATYGAASGATIAIWGMTFSESSLFAVGLSAGLSGTFGLLQSILNPSNTVVPGSQQNSQDSISSRRVIYGYMEVGGVKTFDSAPAGSGAMQNQGRQQNYRHQVYTLSGHQISSFQRHGIYHVVIDGIVTALMLDPGGSGYFVPSDQLNPYGGNTSPTIPELGGFHIAFEFDLGNPSNTGQGLPLLGLACPEWTASCQQRGRAKVHVAMRYDVYADGSQLGTADMVTSTPIYVNGAVPNFRFQITGKPLLDTRLPSGGGHPVWQANTPFGFAQYIYDSLDRLEVQTNGPLGSFQSGPGPAPPNFPAANHAAGEVTQDLECQWLNAGPLQPGGWPGPGATIGYPYVFQDPNGNFQLLQFAEGPPTFQWPLGTFVTGAVQPTWATAPGQQTGDGGQQVNGVLPWLCLGTPSGFAFAANPSNPALIVYDYLTNSDYGEGADPATIDLASINAAANICEERLVVNIASNGRSVSENRYACDGVFPYSATRGDVLTALVSSCAGTLVPPGDLWHLFAGAYAPPTANLTDADLRDSIKFDWRISRRDICNIVKGTFIPAYLPTNTTEAQPLPWRATDFPAYVGDGQKGRPNYIAEDGGARIPKEIRLGFTTSIWMAQRLGKIVLQLLRFQVTGHLACKLTAFRVRAGDTITFTHQRWAALPQPPPTLFFVTQATLVVENVTGVPAIGVDLVLRQTDPSIYTWAAPTLYQPPGSPWVEGDGEYSQYGSVGIL